MLHARPDAQALRAVLADLPNPVHDTSPVGYEASIEARIIVDPATLLSYAREERIYWYAAFGKDPADTILESDHLSATSSYASP